MTEAVGAAAQLSVFDGDGGLVGKEAQELHLVLVKLALLVVENVEHAYDALTALERRAQYAANAPPVQGGGPPFPTLIIVHRQRFAAGRHAPGQPLSQAQRSAQEVVRLVVSCGQLQAIVVGLQQKDAPPARSQQFRRLSRNSGQQRRQFWQGVDL